MDSVETAHPSSSFCDDDEDIEIVMNDYDQDDTSEFQKPVSVATGILLTGGDVHQLSAPLCPNCGSSVPIAENLQMASSTDGSISSQLTSVLSTGLIAANTASSVYNIELDSIDEKPWHQPGSDPTDYFNYGFDEQTWRLYCLRQKSLREEANQSRRITVYEGGPRGSKVAATNTYRSPTPSSTSAATQNIPIIVQASESHFSEEKSPRDSSSSSSLTSRRHRSRSRERDYRKIDRKSESRRLDDGRERIGSDRSTSEYRGDRSTDHYSSASSSRSSSRSSASNGRKSSYRNQ